MPAIVSHWGETEQRAFFFTFCLFVHEFLYNKIPLKSESHNLLIYCGPSFQNVVAVQKTILWQLLRKTCGLVPHLTLELLRIPGSKSLVIPSAV